MDIWYFCAKNMFISRSCLVIIQFQYGVNLSVKYGMMLALRSQIFQYLCETFSEKNMKRQMFFFFISRRVIDLCESLRSVGTRFRHQHHIPRS